MIPSQCIMAQRGFEQALIDAELASIDDAHWIQHVNKADYTGNWSVVALRTAKTHEFSHPILQCYQLELQDEWIDLPLLEKLPEIKALIELLPFSKKSIRLMKLDPEALIQEHSDAGLCIEHGEARFHIPLQSHNGVTFNSNGCELSMSPGELWYINADAPHSVRNEGNTARINLVIDCELSLAEWELFVSEVAQNDVA